MPNTSNYIDYAISIFALLVTTITAILIFRKGRGYKQKQNHVDNTPPSENSGNNSVIYSDVYDSHSNTFIVADRIYDFIPIFSSWKQKENEFSFGNLITEKSDNIYEIPNDLYQNFLEKDARTRKIIEDSSFEPKVRLEKYDINIVGKKDFSKLFLSFSKITYKDFRISNTFLDDTVEDKGITFREKYFHYNSSLTLPYLSNICGVGIFIITCDQKIIVCKSSNRVAVNPNKFIYSASGTMDWDTDKNNVNPFFDVIRECEEEIGYRPALEDVKLFSFGIDNKLGYYQFSFYVQISKTASQIEANAKMATDFHIEMDRLVALDFDSKTIVDHIKNNDWDHTSAANLLILTSKFFSKDAIEKYINPQLATQHLRNDLEFEWEKRAAREGLAAVYSLRFPVDKINEISKNYVMQVKDFIDEPLKNKSILEIGCGIGLFTKYFAQNAKSITAIDISSRMIQRNKEYLGIELSNKVKYAKCFFQDYNENCTYDILISSLVLIHNADDIDAITNKMKEMANTIYLFEQIDDGLTSKFTKTRALDEYIKLFPEYNLKKTEEHYLFTDKIGFIKLVRKKKVLMQNNIVHPLDSDKINKDGNVA